MPNAFATNHVLDTPICGSEASSSIEYLRHCLTVRDGDGARSKKNALPFAERPYLNRLRPYRGRAIIIIQKVNDHAIITDSDIRHLSARASKLRFLGSYGLL